MSSEPQPSGRAKLLVGTVKSVAIIGGLSFMAANWLSSAGLDHSGLARLAARATGGYDDPLTTGSVGRRADAIRLDPCSAAPRR